MRCSIPSLLLAVVGLLIGGSTPLLGSSPPIAVSSSVESADLLESTLRVLRDRIPDLRFNREQLESVRGRFAAAGSRAERREVVRRFLDRIPTSHLALFSSYAKFTFERELAGELSTTLGLTLSWSSFGRSPPTRMDLSSFTVIVTSGLDATAVVGVGVIH